MKPEPLADYVVSSHAAAEAARRGLSEDILRSVLAEPEQRLQVRPGRVVFQSRVRMDPAGREYLLRVFVDVDRSPAEVVTAYRTSKIDKYWKDDE